jgi:hypothetical protein
VSGIGIVGSDLVVARNHVAHLERITADGVQMAPIPIPASSAGASDIAVIGSHVVLAASYLRGTSSVLDLASGTVSPRSGAPSRLDASDGVLVGSGAPGLSATDLSGAAAVVGPSGEIVAYSPTDASFFRAR